MKLKITVHGVAYEVDVEVLDAGDGFPPASASRPRPQGQKAAAGSEATSRPAPSGQPAPAGESGSVASPIAGTLVEIKCKPGDEVKQGDILLVIEAMKMKTSIAAPTAGRVKKVPVAVGDTVRESQVLVEFE